MTSRVLRKFGVFLWPALAAPPFFDLRTSFLFFHLHQIPCSPISRWSYPLDLVRLLTEIRIMSLDSSAFSNGRSFPQPYIFCFSYRLFPLPPRSRAERKTFLPVDVHTPTTGCIFWRDRRSQFPLSISCQSPTPSSFRTSCLLNPSRSPLADSSTLSDRTLRRTSRIRLFARRLKHSDKEDPSRYSSFNQVLNRVLFSPDSFYPSPAILSPVRNLQFIRRGCPAGGFNRMKTPQPSPAWRTLYLLPLLLCLLE